MAIEQYPLGGAGHPQHGQLVVNAGSGVHTLFNADINDIIYLAHGNYVSSTDSSSFPLQPQSFLIVDGKESVWAACDPNVSATLFVIPGGQGYFQSGITSGNFLLNNQGFFMYSPTKGFGNLIFAEVPKDTFDPYGNFAQQGLSIIDTTFGGMIHFNGSTMRVTGGLNTFFTLDTAKLVMYTSAGGALGTQSVSLATAATTDQYGNGIRAGLASYSGANRIAVLIAGQLIFTGLNYHTDASIGDAGGTLNLISATNAAPVGDRAAQMTLQSKNNSFDGLTPEAVFFCRVQLQDGLGNAGFTVPMDPGNPTADESFHHFAFAGAGATLWSSAGTITPGYRLLSDRGRMSLIGRFTVPTGGPVGGQAMTIALPNPYQPARVQSVNAWDLTGANANKPIRCFFDAAGVLNFGGPAASAAAGDTIEVSGEIDLIAT
jgi:hypothetical protein